MDEDAASPRHGVCVIINISSTRLRNKKAFSLDSCRLAFFCLPRCANARPPCRRHKRETIVCTQPSEHEVEDAFM